MSVPTLEELFDRFRKLHSPAYRSSSDSFEQYFRSIASGQEKPELRNSNAVFAAQCVVVLFEHTRTAKGGEA